jgi:hypothetical protein
MSDLCVPFLPRLCHFSQPTLSKPSCAAAPRRRSPGGRLRSTAARRLGARCTVRSRHSCCSPTARARRRRRAARLSARRSARSWRQRRHASHAGSSSRRRNVKRRKARARRLRSLRCAGGSRRRAPPRPRAPTRALTHPLADARGSARVSSCAGRPGADAGPLLPPPPPRWQRTRTSRQEQPVPPAPPCPSV